MQLLKQSAKSIAPELYERLRKAYRYRQRFAAPERRAHKQATARFARIVERLGSQSDWCVQSGPFAGMKYPASAARLQWRGHLLGSALAPKLLGSYEAELHECIAEAVSRRYSTVVDIGTGEGYYAVGLARLLPTAAIHGFELNAEARKFCASMSALNGVETRVRLMAAADLPALRSTVSEGECLLVSDCEGYEAHLLDPVQVPALAHADLLVELHEQLVPGVTELMRERFANTHTIRLIEEAGRAPSNYPTLEALDPSDRELALDEGRPTRMSWAWLTHQTRRK